MVQEGFSKIAAGEEIEQLEAPVDPKQPFKPKSILKKGNNKKKKTKHFDMQVKIREDPIAIIGKNWEKNYNCSFNVPTVALIGDVQIFDSVFVFWHYFGIFCYSVLFSIWQQIFFGLCSMSGFGMKIKIKLC